MSRLSVMRCRSAAAKTGVDVGALLRGAAADTAKTVLGAAGIARAAAEAAAGHAVDMAMIGAAHAAMAIVAAISQRRSGRVRRRARREHAARAAFAVTRRQSRRRGAAGKALAGIDIAAGAAATEENAAIAIAAILVGFDAQSQCQRLGAARGHRRVDGVGGVGDFDIDQAQPLATPFLPLRLERREIGADPQAIAVRTAAEDTRIAPLAAEAGDLEIDQ